MDRLSLSTPTAQLAVRPTLLPIRPLTKRSDADRLVEALAKGATMRQALAQLKIKHKRADHLINKALEEVGLTAAQARNISMETLATISAEMWAVMEKNPWRSAQFLLEIEARKAALLGLDQKSTVDAGEIKVSVQLLQQLIVKTAAA